MRFHSQNLKKEDKTKDLVNFRWWLYFGKDSTLHSQFTIPSHFWSLDIDLCNNGWQEEAIGICVACPLFGLWLGIDNNWLYNLLEPITKRKDGTYTNGRNIGLSFHDGTLWINLWNDPMQSKSVDPKWWSFNIDFKELLIGKAKYLTEILQSGETKINMPEGEYPATFEVTKRTWKYPRWFSKIREDIEFNIPIGIPHEGKGENSWDMGMDATMGIGTEWKGNVHEATKKVAMRCLETRQRYGSLSSPEYAKWREEALKKLNDH